MFEFDTVSVSSFEASSLASTLTEKSADGWEVVSIITAGSDVVAYLRKATPGAETTATAGRAESTEGADAVLVDAATAGTTAETAPRSAGADLLADQTASEPEPAAATPATSSTAADSDGNGWAASTDSTPAGSTAGAASSTGWSSTATGASDSSSSTASPAATADTSGASSWGGSSQQAAATQPASAPQVPAGWYADPAGRFELRYWDGGAWTEHVSRNGQQFTDPPVR